MTKRVWTWGLAGYLVLRWILLTSPGYLVDVPAYKRWSIHIARSGISQVYRNSDMDYPPLYAYILAPVGTFYGWIAPEALETFGDSTVFTILVKLPPLLFDLAVAWLLFRLGRQLDARRQRRGASALGPIATRYLLPMAYLLCPAVLYNHGYGGQPDSVLCFFLLAAFLALARGTREEREHWETEAADAGTTRLLPLKGPALWLRGAWPAWVLLALALCMKPLAAPFFPLFLVLSLAFYGTRSTALGLGAAAATVLLLFVPYLAAGQTTEIAHRMLTDVQVMPYTSSNANNLWWVLGPWKNADLPFLGPFSATQVALSLFGAAYLFVLLRAHALHRRRAGGINREQMLVLAAAVGFSFFILSTQMHDNHLIMLVPLLAGLIPAGRPWRWFFLCLSFGVFLNLLVHDPMMAIRWPWNLGGVTSVENSAMHRPYKGVELTGIWIGVCLNLATYAAFMILSFRGGGKGLMERMGAARGSEAELK